MRQALGLIFVFLLASCQTVEWEPGPPPKFTETTPSSRITPSRAPEPAPSPPAITRAEPEPAADRDSRPSRVPRERPPKKDRLPLAGLELIVDAGHGGHDPGTPGSVGVPEKTVVLALSRRLAEMLREKGAKVTLSRTRDVFLPLTTRAALAAQMKTDLFLSVHADASERPGVQGATMYISPGASLSSRRYATALEGSFKKSRIRCRGVRTAEFHVLVKHPRPAVLIECGFLTNPEEGRKLTTSAYQKKIARTIVDGIIAGHRQIVARSG